MKNIFHYLSIIALMLTVSCSTNSTTNPPTKNPVDVYVAGRKNGKACYWKNNQIVVLDNEIMSNSNATKIIVSNGDVYVLGTYVADIAPTPQYVYWKNGVKTFLMQTLSDSNQVLNRIIDFDVYGNDTYFIGFTKNPLLTVETYDFVCWKNGVKTIYTANGTKYEQHAIKVYNNIVYVTGVKIISGHQLERGYFVNNTFVKSENFFNSKFAIKNNSVCVYGRVFYPVEPYPSFFKNLNTGTETSLPIAFLNKLVCDDNDNYVSDDIKILKNNTIIYNVPLPDFDKIKDFEVLNGNTYIISQLGDFGTTDHLYINNVDVFNIESNSSSMNYIAIVQN